MASKYRKPGVKVTSRIRDRAYRQVCSQKGRNITIGSAISPIYSVLFHSIHFGGMTRNLSKNFLVNTSAVLDENAYHCIIFDGAPCHKKSGSAMSEKYTETIFLPSYSPFLNHVEQATSCLKADIKADIARPEIQEQ